jgi:hypothetical protein
MEVTVKWRRERGSQAAPVSCGLTDLYMSSLRNVVNSGLRSLAVAFSKNQKVIAGYNKN